MFAGIARRYDLANHLLSGGLDFLWRRRAAMLARQWKPERILDLATGSGDLALTLAAACPGSTIIGADFCLPMLQVSQRKGLRNLVVADGLALPFEDQAFDLLTVAFGLRNMASWTGALQEMHRVLKPGGHLLILDFSVPPAPLRWIYRPYLHFVLPRVAAFVTGEKAAYDYLADSIETFPHGAAMCALLKETGFEAAQWKPLTGGIVSLYVAERSIRAASQA
ncbi:MAG: ubiquinone/menaquinone biosynthesis methyltransferase [Chthoniobacteraceae bacterium]|nr:ubiquinone/menaquinone biosynthesis methyltransferase [Chthoniobacteraceae bacterium]